MVFVFCASILLSLIIVAAIIFYLSKKRINVCILYQVSCICIIGLSHFELCVSSVTFNFMLRRYYYNSSVKFGMVSSKNLFVHNVKVQPIRKIVFSHYHKYFIPQLRNNKIT